MGSITAAPITVTFSDGKEWQFTPLTDRDMDELDEWAQSRIIMLARRSLPPDATDKEREETLRLAMQEASKTSIYRQGGGERLANLAGLTYLAYISLRKRHPEVTQDYLHMILSNPENLEIFNEAMARGNSLDNISVPSVPSKKVKTVRQKPKR